MRRLRAIGICLLVVAGLYLLLAMQVGAFPRYPWANSPRTYYVSLAGNDSNLGTSEASPWLTMVKVRTQTYRPGDRILLRGGDTFSDDELIVPSSGRPDAPILFSSYGTGRAIIQGDLNEAIYIQNKHDLIFRNINTATPSAPYGVRIDGGAGYLYNVLFENCDFGSATLAAVILRDGVAGNISHIRFVNCTAHNAGQGWQTKQTAGITCRDVEWVNCTAYNITGTVNLNHGWYIMYADDVRLIRCIGYGNIGHAFQFQSGVTNILVDSCKAYTNTSMGMYLLGVTGGTVVNSLFWDNGGIGIDVRADCLNVAFYHNSIVNNGSYGLQIKNPATGNILKNNLFYQDATVIGTGKNPIRVDGSAQLISNTLNYNNTFYPGGVAGKPFNVGGTDKTLAEWQAYTGTPDINGTAVAPVFVTNYSDLHLAFGSPISVTAVTGLGVIQDYDAQLRGATPSVGCYEYP